MQPSAHQRSALDLKTIIRLPQLVKLVGLSRSTVYLRLNTKTKYYDPSFPKPIQLGMKAVGWKLADVYSYIEKLRYREIDL
ncbi:AlpA family phage regulatory protein [Comamonas thiooxydans]|nr:AlpA family phage regulatory protein [Comamonas thiooxydans]